MLRGLAVMAPSSGRHDIFGVAAELGAEHSDDFVAGVKFVDLRPHGRDDACKVHAKDSVARPEEAEAFRGQQPEPFGNVAAPGTVVSGAHRARVDFDQHVAWTG